MNKLFILALVSVAFVACDRHESPKTGYQNERDYEADNTGRNVRDRDSTFTRNQDAYNGRDADATFARDRDSTLIRDRDTTFTRNNGSNATPFDQSESDADRTLTQKIRQAIQADDSLSTNAKNIKIITQNGVVILRGPVLNSRERDAIAKKVHDLRGVTRVDNQLEVTRS